ncbi:MAG: response regulator [Anaerolineales bacterium]|nr:response regulator [Anaerolineales bacterium]
MDWQLSPYAVPLILTGLITLVSAVYAFRQQNVSGSNDLFYLLLAITVWIFAYVAELSAITLDSKLFWAKVQYFGIVYLPVGYVLFVLKYIGEFQKIKRPFRFTALLFLVPVLTLSLAWTNEWHHLIWTSVGLAFEQSLSYLALEHGTWFWIQIAFVYLALASSTILLLRRILTMPDQFKGQIILVVAGSLSPWVGNILYITDSNPFPHLDLTPFAFAATALFFTLALFRFNFLDIVPVAREMVIEKLENGVIVLDGQNRVVDINETAVTLLQQNKKQIMGRELAFNHSDWHPLAIALEESQPARLELSLEQTYYEISVLNFENVNGKTNGRLITLHNITNRKETELLLQQAKESAEAANQAKTHFLTNMSHEIRTPLNAVVGMGEMLRQTNLNANQKEMVDVVAQSSNDLVLLINNILDFAHLEAGDLQLKHQSFSLLDCVEAAIEQVQPAANSKLLQLGYKIADDTPTNLAGDPVRLRQILVNLLENGVKFSEEGTVQLNISHVQQASGVLLHFVVRDTGIGIAADQIENLFLPFQQVDGSLTRSHGGNGLGLVICKRLVELMGGDIYLHSEIGKGTSVHFSAQLREATENDPPAVRLRKNHATLASKRLLVVVADATQRRHISKEARTAGLDVYVAGSVSEAAYWIQRSLPFDVVLLETAVYQTDPAIMAKLQNPETNTPLPTILLGQDEENLHQIVAADPDLFAGTLTIPVTGSQLYDLLLNILAVGSDFSKAREIGETMASQFPLRILLAEDNQLNRRIITNMLDKLGYEVDTAVNGRVAVEMASQHAYDIILMDIQMPEMDGVAATKQILANITNGDRPYISAVTAHALAGDRESYLAVGMNHYLSKPVTINQLVEVLYQAIEFGQHAHPAPAFAPTAEPIMAAPPEPISQPHQPLTKETGEPPIDLEELAQLVGEDTDEFLAMMAPIFLEDTQKLMHTLRHAVQKVDAPIIRQSTHTLKGTSASMGMTRLAQLSRELELMAKADDLADAPQILAQIEDEYQRIQVALLAFSETAV